MSFLSLRIVGSNTYRKTLRPCILFKSFFNSKRYFQNTISRLTQMENESCQQEEKGKESVTPYQLAFNCVIPEEWDSKKSPVVFLHGYTESKAKWGDIPKIVAKETKRKVYAIDARNHGDSKWSDNWDLLRNYDDFLYFLKIINATKAILVGHSMGGVTAELTALNSSEFVEKLVVEDIGVTTIPEEAFDVLPLYLKLGREALKRLPETADVKTGVKFITDYVMEHIPDDIREFTVPADLECSFVLKKCCHGKLAFQNNLEVLEKALRALKYTNAPEVSTTFQGPTLYIYGTVSPIELHKQFDDIKKYFPNAEFTAMEGAGHCAHEERPAEFTKILLEYLSHE